MKKILLLLVVLFSSVGCTSIRVGEHHTSKEVTEFMGVPVDGAKADMIFALQKKGFTPHHTKDCLEGTLNGSHVEVYVSTYNDKVWRVLVSFTDKEELPEVITAYNNLFDGFVVDPEYVHGSGSKVFKSPENVLYPDIRSGRNPYQTSFYQRKSKEEDVDSKEVNMRRVWFGVYSNYSDIKQYELILCYENLYNQKETA